MNAPAPRVVVTDANVLINLVHVGRLDLCAQLPGHEFVVPDHVSAEISKDVQRAALDSAVARGVVRVESITSLEAVGFFTDLTVHIGRGEAACLALANERGWSIASDEKRCFRREAVRLIGSDRILGTADLVVLAIRAGLLTVEEADADKAVLERHRFKMSFASFRDLMK